MADRRKQVPIGCAVNVAIVTEVSRSEAFKKACVEVPQRYGIQHPNPGEAWPFFNSSWGAYIMYCLFVVSKEIYNLPKEDDFYTGLVAKDAMKDFQLHKERHSFSDDPKYHFASFRNSVSHVNYEIDDEKIMLWDHPPRRNQPADWHWHVEIKHEAFKEFLDVVNEANFKIYNEINSGVRNPDGTKK